MCDSQCAVITFGPKQTLADGNRARLGKQDPNRWIKMQHGWRRMEKSTGTQIRGKRNPENVL